MHRRWMAEVKGDYAPNAGRLHPDIRHILDTANMISGGIIGHFSSRSDSEHRILPRVSVCEPERLAAPRPRSVAAGRGAGEPGGLAPCDVFRSRVSQLAVIANRPPERGQARR